MAGGFPLAKWVSTSMPLIKTISSQEIAHNSLSLDDCDTKILGLRWNFYHDTFTFSSKTFTNVNFTKRLLLSEISQIFDPLGFVSPIIIRGKVMLQELWLLKLSWDETLPLNIQLRWQTFREDLTSLAKLSILRWFNTTNETTVELHGFSDASQCAMAAVVYITTISSSTNLTTTSLICAKTKVAPLKKLTIPRLELTAALILAKLAKYVQATLTLNFKAVYLWTDSQVALNWINSHPSRWKDYVRNRVTQIRELVPHAQWRHVPGTSNPVDCASRGVTTAQLEQHQLWWKGPPWLTKSSDSWPKQPAQFSFPLDDSSAREVRPGTIALLNATVLTYKWDLIYNISSLTNLFTITSLCFRFINRLKKQSYVQPLAIISSHDILEATLYWIKETQHLYFSSELKQLSRNMTLHSSHPFSRLTAYIDGEGIIRVGGRLLHANLTHEHKHPAILPRNSQLSTLIIDHAHKRTLHGGTQVTLAFIRQNYWIIGGRAPVKTFILRCVVCARQRGIRAHQMMGQLPFSRVTLSQPFTHTGIDYAGPMVLKTWKGRGSRTQKGWICVFVCFSTSAVHLELVTDYATEGFIATYRRFVARRGIPHTIYSDCGTNFVGADAQLQRMFKQGTQEHHQLNKVFVNDHTIWKFNPPAAPHMGGKWEAVVKSVKFHLRRTIGETLLTYEEFTTLLCEIEALLNSRPLEPLSDDPDDLSVLTPSHFLMGRSINALPEASIIDVPVSNRNSWRVIQQKVQQFWKQWSSQYLQRMQSISKWHHPSHELKVGSIVLITDERSPPSKWPLARIQSLIPGPDGLSRVAMIRTATTTLTRPIAKLAILPVDKDQSSPDQPSVNDGGRNVQN